MNRAEHIADALTDTGEPFDAREYLLSDPTDLSRFGFHYLGAVPETWSYLIRAENTQEHFTLGVRQQSEHGLPGYFISFFLTGRGLCLWRMWVEQDFVAAHGADLIKLFESALRMGSDAQAMSDFFGASVRKLYRRWQEVAESELPAPADDFDPREYMLDDQGLHDLRQWLEGRGFKQGERPGNECWRKSFWYQGDDNRRVRDRSAYSVWEDPDQPGKWHFQRKDFVVYTQNRPAKEDVIQQFHGTPAEMLVHAKKFTPVDDRMQESEPPAPADDFDAAAYFNQPQWPPTGFVQRGPKAIYGHQSKETFTDAEGRKYRFNIHIYPDDRQYILTVYGRYFDSWHDFHQQRVKFEDDLEGYMEAIKATIAKQKPSTRSYPNLPDFERFKHAAQHILPEAELPTPVDNFDPREYMLGADVAELKNVLVAKGFKETDQNFWYKEEIAEGPKVVDIAGSQKIQRYSHIVIHEDGNWMYRRYHATAHGWAIDAKVTDSVNKIIDALEQWDKQKTLRQYLYQESDDFDAREYLLSLKAYEGPPPGKEYWVLFKEGTAQRAVKLYTFKAAQRFVHDKNLERDSSLVLRVRQKDDTSRDYTRQPDGSYKEVDIRQDYKEEYVEPVKFVESEEEENILQYSINVPVKPFGWIGVSPATNIKRAGYLNTRSDFLVHVIGDAQVFKRRSSLDKWSHLEATPVYSNPRKTGDGALDPYFKPPVYNFKTEQLPESEVTEAVKRRKLYDGAVLDHYTLGRLTVKVTKLDAMPPRERWEVYNKEGKLAAPTCYSERDLYFTLRSYWSSEPVKFVESELAQPPDDFDAKEYLLSAPREKFSYRVITLANGYGPYGCEILFGDTVLDWHGECADEDDAKKLGQYWVGWLTKLDNWLPYDPIEYPQWIDWYTKVYPRAKADHVNESQDDFDARDYLLSDPQSRFSYTAYATAGQHRWVVEILFDGKTFSKISRDNEYQANKMGPVWVKEFNELNAVLPYIPDRYTNGYYWKEDALNLLKQRRNESQDDFDAREYILSGNRDLFNYNVYVSQDTVYEGMWACDIWFGDDDHYDTHHFVDEDDAHKFGSELVDWLNALDAAVPYDSDEYVTWVAWLDKANDVYSQQRQLRNESLADDIAKEAEKAEQPKSEEQAEAGNQKKGHISLQGFEIAIENAKGSVRKSKDPENPWQVTMPSHYGYIKGTTGKDKDHLDVFIGEHPGALLAFVINQKKKEGGFDEHKIMLGFKTKDEAIETYDKAFTGDLGPKLRGEVFSVTIDNLKAWIEKGDTKKPFKPVEESRAVAIAQAMLEADEDFDAREYFLSSDKSKPRGNSADLSDDIWQDDKKLRNAFSWLTRIGVAPKFGTTSIHNYQQEMGRAIGTFKSLANRKGIDLAWVRYRNGVVYGYSAGRWEAFARTMYNHILPV